jgi:hypothetical protein
MELPALLDEFGRTAGLGRVALNDEGVCRLVLDEDLTVDVEVAPEASRAAGSFFLHAVAGRLPAGDGDPGLLKELLAANLFGRDTGGATLALDPDLGEVVLLRELGAEATDYGTFAAALERFVNALDRWRGRLAKGAAPAAGPTTSRSPVMYPEFLIRG